MPEQLGRNILVSVGDGATSENFSNVGGLRTRSVAINNELVDISNSDTGVWRKLLSGAGQTSVVFSGSGVFTDDVAIGLMESYALAGQVDNYKITMPNGEVWSGAFQVTNFSYSGEYNNAQLYDWALESSGTITIV